MSRTNYICVTWRAKGVCLWWVIRKHMSKSIIFKQKIIFQKATGLLISIWALTQEANKQVNLFWTLGGKIWTKVGMVSSLWWRHKKTKIPRTCDLLNCDNYKVANLVFIHISEHLVGFYNTSPANKESSSKASTPIQLDPAERGPLSCVVGYIINKLFQLKKKKREAIQTRDYFAACYEISWNKQLHFGSNKRRACYPQAVI